MTLISRPFNASDGILVDTSQKLTLTSARAMWAAGARGVWRYFFFGSPRPGDLDAAELQMLLGLGYWVGGVQHVPLPSWRADGPTGRQHAAAAVANAIRAGFVTPAGCHPIALALDAEGVGNPGPAMVDYCRSGFQVRRTQGYQNVGYNGYLCGLTSADLDAFADDPSCGDPEWWADFASLSQRPTPKKGYAGHQKAQSTMGGVGVDVDQVLRDGVLYGLVDADLHVDDVDPREAPTSPEIPLPFDPTSIPPPALDKA